MSVKNADRRERTRYFGSGGSGGGHSVNRFLGPLLIACAIVAMLGAAGYWFNRGEVYRGVEVAGVPLGGKTPAEAEALLDDRVDGALKQIRLTSGEGDDITLDASEMGVDFKVDQSVQKAYQVGREGSIVERLQGRVGALVSGASVEPVVNYDSGVARSAIKEIASERDQEPTNASLSVIYENVDMTRSSEGYRVDQDQTLQNVSSAVKDLSGEAKIAGETLKPEVTTSEVEQAADRARTALDAPVTIKAGGQDWELTPREIGHSIQVQQKDGNVSLSVNTGVLRNYLDDMYSELEQKPEEAGFEVQGENISVTPSQTGEKIQSKQLFDQIKNGVFDGKRVYEASVVTAKPELTTAEAEAKKPTELIGTYKTNYLTYSDSPGRVANLQIASNAINNTVVAPGEIFSFNDIAANLDYESSKVIMGGEVQDADGGGLCQVSSTLYMAVQEAGLQPVERHPHSAELPYIRPGFDATIWFGRNGTQELDMKFKNTSDAYVLIKQSVDTSTGNVYASVYGQPTGKNVTMSSQKVSDSGGNTQWVTYKQVTENGKVVEDQAIHTDNYKPLEEGD